MVHRFGDSIPRVAALVGAMCLVGNAIVVFGLFAITGW
jgi:hypothetical protein